MMIFLVVRNARGVHSLMSPGDLEVEIQTWMTSSGAKNCTDRHNCYVNKLQTMNTNDIC